MSVLPVSVSIIIPNLNYRKYLNERIETIISQTKSNWECIVIDGYSDDGSWEFFQEVARKDSRFRIFQESRSGIYNALNKGIERSQGEFIYIATSDDTMHRQFLEKMSRALSENPECDIAHCCMTIIDENSVVTARKWEDFPSSAFFGEMLLKKHVRYVPFDSVLHSSLATIYHSLHQLLIRKTVFEKSGFFSNDFGPIGDFEWGLRVSLRHSVIHIPDYLCGWRTHQDQATTTNLRNSPQHSRLFLQMIASAMKKTNANIDLYDMQYFYGTEYIIKTLSGRGLLSKVIGLVKCFIFYPRITFSYIENKILGKQVLENKKDYANKLILKYDLANKIITKI